MREDLRALLDAHHGVVATAQLATLRHHHVDRAVSGGHLVRVFPGVWTEPGLLLDPGVRRLAALRYAGKSAALSHTTGLEAWGLPVPPQDRLHVTASRRRQLRSAEGLTVHRAVGFDAWPLAVRHGLPVLTLERCLVQSWPMLGPQERRAAVIAAVQERRTVPHRIRPLVPRTLPGRPQLVDLLDMLAAGCRSEFEIWGCLHVFTHPSLPAAVRQHPVRLRGRTVYLDVAYWAEMVGVELDGAAFHRDRELDLRRDAALAALGWVTVRLSWCRCHEEPEAVRRELRDLLAVRRAQLAA